MKVDIISPEKTIWSGQATLVALPGAKGAFEMLNNHAPIISSLTKGVVKIVQQDKSQLTFEIEGGIIESNNNKVNILVK